MNSKPNGELRLALLGLMMMAAFVWAGCPSDADDDVVDDDDDDAADDDDTADDDDDDLWEPRFDALVEALLVDLDASDAPGVSVAVMEGGEVTFARGFGSAHPDEQLPVHTSTLFQIGSTTKMMAVAALLQKVEAGELAVDDTVDVLLPELEFYLDPTWTEDIQVHHLLSHQGGFCDYIPWDGSSNDGDLAEHTYGFYANNLYLMNPPGEFWNYSNPNFSLAGLITEELDDRMWPDIVEQDVLLPLGMDRTYARKSSVEEDGDYAVSYGYYVNGNSYSTGTVEMEAVEDPAWARPAGMVWSTPSQMVLFAQFLMDGDPAVLDDTLRQEMVSEQVNTLYFEDEMHYGYGVFVERGYLTGNNDYYDVPVYNHGGNTLSFTSILTALPEQDFAISILSSGYGTNFYGALDVAIETLAGVPDAVDPPEIIIDPERFTDHEGEYLDVYNVGEVIITREGDSLMVEMPLLEQYGYTVDPELIPVSSEIFYLGIDGDYYDVTFVGDGPGEPSRYMRNRSYVATRDESGKARAEIATSREQIDATLARARMASPVRLPRVPQP